MTENYYKGAEVLITGGLGFIGSNLARRLVEYGANVTVADSLIPEYGGNLYNICGLAEKLRVNISDVRDEHSMSYLVRDKDVLFNLAGQTSHMDSMTAPQADLDINCRAQLSILEACRKFNKAVKIVYASTRQIYGRPVRLPVNEEHPIRPVDVNGINKLAGELYHQLYNDVHELRACALRLTNTYGPRMRVKDARQTFVGVWIRRVLEGDPFEVWGGDQLRDFNYVDDCIDALLLAGCHDSVNGKVFNLGDSSVVSLRQLADMLIKVNGAGNYIIRTFPEDRKRIDIGDYYSDFTRFKEVTGWRPSTSLEAGLATTLAYFRKELQHYV